MRFVLSLLLALATVALTLLPRPACARDYQSAIVRGLVGFPNETASPAPVATTAASARTATDVPKESYVRIVCTAKTFFRFGDATVVATLNDAYLLANVPEVFNMGSFARRIAFINEAAGTGTCKVTVMQ